MADNDGVFPWSCRDCHFDLGVRLGELWEERLEEGVHAPGASSPVAVVEVHLLALEHECADAILAGRNGSDCLNRHLC